MDDCRGVLAAMMMCARPPQLLACSAGGWGGGRLQGHCWGEGKRKLKSWRAVSIINASLVYRERDLMAAKDGTRV